MADAIAVINAGSSSVKFSVYQLAGDEDLSLDCKGQVEGIGSRPRFVASDAAGVGLADQSFAAAQLEDHADAFARIGAWLRARLHGKRLVAVGHRVVHGGPDLARPVVLDVAVTARLEALVPLAPLHQPHNLAGIRAIGSDFPDLLQVACFDTAFHRDHPEVADRFAIPDALYREGVRRYGFHGLSYEYIAGALRQVAPEVAEGRVVVAHLGSGASMCAIRGGRSIDSTMSFTALDGLPMGTRCGALDPGVLLYLIAEHGYDVQRLERLLYHECGLRGLSGVSNDVRDLLASDDPGAVRALDYFVYRIGRELGGLVAALGGIDALVFTAGVGEHAADIRARVCAEATWLGLTLDGAANRSGGPRISAANAAVSAWVIPTDEERMIATHTRRLWARRRTVRPPE